MDILNMLDKIRNTQGCIVYSPCGLPILSEGVDLPNDLKVFYENCEVCLSLLIVRMGLGL